MFFEWNIKKANQNRHKHGVSFEEAASVFADPLSVTIPDSLHSSPGDERLALVGQSSRRRLLVVVHLELGKRLRIISARRGTAHERKTYEEGS